jgi:hypothetical protein
MVDGDGTLISTRCSTNPATVAIPLQDDLSQAAKILLVLLLEHVTGCTVAVRADLLPAATTIERPLDPRLHPLTVRTRNPSPQCPLRFVYYNI